MEEKAAEKAKLKAKKSRKKSVMKKRLSGSFEVADLVNVMVFSLSATVILGFFAWAYPGLRFPIGGLLCVMGFIVYLIGTYGFSQIAREESMHHYFACRFVPLYK